MQKVMNQHRKPIRDQKGYALLSVFLLVLIIGGLVGAGLLGTRLELQSTKNLVAANQAFYAAESGLLHSLSVINGMGVTDFQSEIVERWEDRDLFGSARKEMPGNPSLRYEVQVTADETAPGDRGRLTVTGYAGPRASRTLEVRLCKGPLLPAGAVHIFRKSSCGTFRGNAFRIDGTDHERDGSACNVSGDPRRGCQSDPVPGVSTRDEDTARCVEDALLQEQGDNVVGAGGEPSIVRIGGPDSAELLMLADSILSNPSVVRSAAPFVTETMSLGTLEEPQITHLTGDGTVKLVGNASGAGILIVDHDLQLSGNFAFLGWIITRGELSVLGSVSVLGSIWTGAFNMVAGGSTSVEYCSACLDMLDRLPGTDAGNFPHLMQVCGWAERN